MSAPLWTYPGIREGRIQPVDSSIAALPGYAFCLGADDDAFRDHRFVVGDSIYIQQTFTPAVAEKLIILKWQLRIPSGMPVSRNISGGTTVSFVKGDVGDSSNTGLMVNTPALYPGGGGDTCRGILLDSADSVFVESDAERIVQISNATDAANNGQFRISGVPPYTLTSPGLAAVVENAAMVHRLFDAGGAGGVIVRVLGARWVGRIYYNTGGGMTEYFGHVEQEGHDIVRANIAVNVSKLVGAITIRFALELEALP